MKPVWKMGKGQAAKWMVIWAAFGVGCLLIDASHLMLVALCFLLSAAIYGWRVWYLVSRDQRNAALSYAVAEEPEPAFQPKAPRQDGIFNPGRGPHS